MALMVIALVTQVRAAFWGVLTSNKTYIFATMQVTQDLTHCAYINPILGDNTWFVA